jgi:hypothetical protein
MTDHSRDPGRIDLRAIDASNEERVVANVMSTIRSMPVEETVDVWWSIGRYARPVLAAAAGFVIIALGVVALTRRGADETQYASTLEEWTTSSHVPTNGELLATFQGYQR